MNITVIGAGNSGLAMAAHLSSEGHKITLWNRSEATISNLAKTKTIKSEGMLEGTFLIDQVTTNLEIAIENAELILITTPASSHEDIAERLANLINRNIPIVLNPGRTFGAIRFKKILQDNNCKADPTIAETQTIIYTCRKINDDKVIIYSFKKNVLISTLNEKEKGNIIKFLPECLKQYLAVSKSIYETSLGNVGMILHCAPLMLNSGWTEIEKKTYKYYYDGITPTVSRLVEKIDNERICVSKELGHEVESTKDWLRRTYAVEGETLFECIQNNEAYKEIDAPTSLHHRYIYEDVPFGLVPLEKVGKSLGLEMKYTTLIIDLAEALMDEDFRSCTANICINDIISEKDL